MNPRKLSAFGARRLLVLALLWFTNGCASTHRKHELDRTPQPGVIDPHQPRELQMVSMPPHVVEPPDELELSVRPASADFAVTTVTVQADGNLDLGFLGDVYVAGLTLQQTEQKVAQRLTAIAGKDAPKSGYQVSVRLLNGKDSEAYYVIGAVKQEGRYPLTGNDTVLDAILQAGLRSNSFPEKAYLVRPHPAGGPNQILRVDWDGIKERGDTLTNYQIFPGDRIIVPGGKPPGVLRSLIGG
jgi:polysaccharide export outer membrane protein